LTDDGSKLTEYNESQGSIMNRHSSGNSTPKLTDFLIAEADFCFGIILIAVKEYYICRPKWWS